MINMKTAILTLSDKGHHGQREDLSGPAIADFMTGMGAVIVARDILPDEIEVIEQKLVYYCDELKVDLVLTTGGTGFSPRDFTPEATKRVIEREVPGIAEAMRHESLKITPHAMLSRAASGIRGRTLIVNLPGSPKACKECLETIRPALHHGIEVLCDQAEECATPSP